MWCLSHVSSLVDFLLHYGLQNCQMRDGVRVQEFVLRIIDIFQLVSFRKEKKSPRFPKHCTMHPEKCVFTALLNIAGVVFQEILINIMSI